MAEGGCRILLVDDEWLFALSLQNALEKAEFVVSIARNGLEALSLLEDQVVDVILCDIAMPLMNGYQLIHCVQSQSHLERIPFVFISDRSLDSDIEYGLSLGADAYLTKPVHANEVIQLLQALPTNPVQGNDEGKSEAAAIRRIGRLGIQSDQYKAWWDDEPLALSSREFRLLERLAREPGVVVSFEALLTETHGNVSGSTRTARLLRPLVRSIRRKMGFKTGEVGCVRNLRGIGYMLIVPPDSSLEGSRPRLANKELTNE
jgi:DNA-binding response OmpR family regulator